jgi:hypothetical protein
MNDSFTQYYRCPERYVRFGLKKPLSKTPGYFRFGEDLICYGNYCGDKVANSPTGPLHDAIQDTLVEDGITFLPFDPSQVVDNYRCELYMNSWRSGSYMSLLSKAYYFIRPILPVAVRRHLQKFYLRDWDKLAFPSWPVDCSVGNLFEKLFLFCLRSNSVERIPFIWFWPNGAPSASIMTHDVETEAGRNYCATLMDIDDSFKIKSSFEIIPEERYGVDQDFLQSVRDRGFEVVIHDLNHDGHLYKDRNQFLERAAKINSYGRKYAATGFRSGALYRRQVWYDALEFSYDMSVPNVAHLDPQRGGCCTVMPYFLGEILELPVTATQDYTLFHILEDYSIDLWKHQIQLIMEKHGLISFIVHPDYIMSARERRVYEALLDLLVRLREERGIWIATPGEVNLWWRQRNEMTIVEEGENCRIEGPGKERASIAYASQRDGQLVITVGSGK